MQGLRGWHEKISRSPLLDRINSGAISQISVKFKVLYRLPFEAVNVSSVRINPEVISAFGTLLAPGIILMSSSLSPGAVQP